MTLEEVIELQQKEIKNLTSICDGLHEEIMKHNEVLTKLCLEIININEDIYKLKLKEVEA